MASSGGNGTVNDVYREAMRCSQFVGKFGGRADGDLLALRTQVPQRPPTFGASASSASVQLEEDASNCDISGLKRRRNASVIDVLPAITHASVNKMPSSSGPAPARGSDLKCDSASSLAGAAVEYTDDEKKFGCSILQIRRSAAGFSVTLRQPLSSEMTQQRPLSKLGRHQRLPLLYAMLCRPDVCDLEVLQAAIAACSTEEPFVIPVAKHGVRGSVSFLVPKSGVIDLPESASCIAEAMPVASTAALPVDVAEAVPVASVRMRSIELLGSSEDEADVVPEAGPPVWSNPDDPKCSYLYVPGVDAHTLRVAESVLLPRSRGTRVALPWAGWESSKVVCNPRSGTYCTAGGVQCLWDGEMLNDEVSPCTVGSWSSSD